MKTKLKSGIQRILSLAICFIFVFNFASLNAFAESNVIDFEESGIEQFIISQNSGIGIKTVGDNKVLNITPNIDGVNAYAQYNFTPKAGVPASLSYDFIIEGTLKNGTTIASISEGYSEFLKIEVKDGTLVYKNREGGSINLVESIYAGRWYNLKLSMNFDNGTYDVYVDENCVLKNQNGLADYSFASKAVKLSMSTKYTPGLSIDNFSVTNTKPLASLTIEGEDLITLGENMKATFEYEVFAYDGDENELEGLTYDYTVKPDGVGVEVSLNENILTVNISETAEGEYELFAISGSMVGKKLIRIERYASAPTSMEILGDGKLAYGFNDNTYPFRTKIYDQAGNVIDSSDVYYILEGDVPAEVQLESETGTITVTGDLPKDHYITLKAIHNYNPELTAEKTVVLTDSLTYQNDKYIFDIVKLHIENIYKYASDPYNETPLLAQAIDRLSMTPAVWTETQEISHIPSNQAALSQFQRACDSIYLITGEEIYRERIDESNKFFFENYVNEGGLPYWGGHVYIDLETSEEYRHPTYTKNTHELKGHDPYMDSFYRVDPETSVYFTMADFIHHITDWDTFDLSRHGSYDVMPNLSTFDANTRTYTPSTKGFSPAYTQNLGFSSTLYGFARLATDMYKHTGDERAATLFMKIWDAFWRVSSSDPDYWLDVPQNTTAGRKGYPDEAIQGVREITEGPPGQPGKWWLLDPVPSYLQVTSFGDRYWRARGDDLIDQGYITEEEEWKVRECYYLGGMETNPPYLYWEFIDAIGEDHKYYDIVVERAIRNVSNYIRMAYDPSLHKINHMLIDGTDLTGFVCKRAGYYGGIGQVYNRFNPGVSLFPSVALTYARSLKYPQYQEQSDIMWTFLKQFAEDNDLGIIGDKKAGDAGTDANVNTTKADEELILGFLYLYEGTGNTQFLDMARQIARNFVDEYTEDGFIVEQKDMRYIYSGGTGSNAVFILTLLEAAIRGEFDKCPSYVTHTGFYEGYLFLEHLGEQRNSGNEYNAWQIPMPKVDIKEINITKDELELKVGETYTVEYTIYPNDTGYTGVYTASSDTSCVSVSLDSNTLQAIKPGTVEVVVRSTNDIAVYDTLKVTVVE